jgi:predicted nucleotidyltransferase
MIKAIISTTLCCLFSFGSYAQSQISEWRLVKISQIYSHDNPNTSEYIYDDWGKLKAINQYYNDNSGKKWDGITVKDFVYNKGGYITGFINYEATGNLQYVFDYESKNRLIKRQIYKIAANAKNPAKKLAYVLKYSYKGNEIKESLIKPPSESIVEETTSRLT